MINQSLLPISKFKSININLFLEYMDLEFIKKSFVQQVNSPVWSTEISLKLGPFEKWLVTEFQVRIFGARNANSAYFAKLC